MRLLAASLLLVVAWGPGCARPCTDFAALADIQFVHEGSNATVVDGFRELGWEIRWEPGVSSLSFFIEQTYAGTRYSGVVHPSGLERAGDVRAWFQGSLEGETTKERSEEHLAPLAEPVVARFGGNVTYGAGGRHCGEI